MPGSEEGPQVGTWIVGLTEEEEPSPQHQRMEWMERGGHGWVLRHLRIFAWANFEGKVSLWAAVHLLASGDTMPCILRVDR